MAVLQASCASYEAILSGCSASLEQCCKSRQLSAHGWAQDRLFGFNLWAAEVGAFAEGRDAMRERLRDSVRTFEVLVVLLQSLLAAAQSCLSQAGQPHPPGSLVEAQVQVDGLIGSLVKLGPLIWKASRPSCLSKADATFKSADYSHLEKQLEIVLQKSVTLEKLVDIDEDQSTSADDMVHTILLTGLRPSQRRLIEAGLRRRHRFAWARCCFDSIQDPKWLEPNSKLARDTQAFKPRTAAALTATTSEVDYPNPPAIVHYPDTQQFLCPCCWETLPVQTARDMKQWKAHIAGDLQPYVCPHDFCAATEMFFPNKQSLVQHLRNGHIRVSEWRCFLCEQPTFSNLFDIQFHIRTAHPGDVEDEDVESAVSISAVSVVDIPAVCPVCQASPENYLQQEPRHVGDTFLDHLCRHTHEFSLRSLPWNDRSPKQPRNYIDHDVDTTTAQAAHDIHSPVSDWLNRRSSDFRYEFIHSELIQMIPPDYRVSRIPTELATTPTDNEKPRSPVKSWFQPISTDTGERFDTAISTSHLPDDEYFEDEDRTEIELADSVPTEAFAEHVRSILLKLSGISILATDVHNQDSTLFQSLRQNLLTVLGELAFQPSSLTRKRQIVIRQLARQHGPFEQFGIVLCAATSLTTILKPCEQLDRLLGMVISTGLDPEHSKIMFAMAHFVDWLSKDPP